MKRTSVVLVLAAVVLAAASAPGQETVPKTAPAIAAAPASPAAPQEKKSREPMLELDEQPSPVKTVPPKYPEAAVKDSVEGTVYLNVQIDAKGIVGGVTVLKSTNPILNQAAIDAMKQWTFKPAIKGGSPVATTVVVPFKFRLAGPEKKR